MVSVWVGKDTGVVAVAERSLLSRGYFFVRILSTSRTVRAPGNALLLLQCIRQQESLWQLFAAFSIFIHPTTVDSE